MCVIKCLVCVVVIERRPRLKLAVWWWMCFIKDEPGPESPPGFYLGVEACYFCISINSVHIYLFTKRLRRD